MRDKGKNGGESFKSMELKHIWSCTHVTTSYQNFDEGQEQIWRRVQIKGTEVHFELHTSSYFKSTFATTHISLGVIKIVMREDIKNVRESFRSKELECIKSCTYLI